MEKYEKNGKKTKSNQEDLKWYYKVNVALTALEELRKKLVQSNKYDTVIIKKTDLETFLQNILLGLEDYNYLAEGYSKVKERADLLNDLYLRSSESERFFLRKWMEARRKELVNA